MIAFCFYFLEFGFYTNLENNHRSRTQSYLHRVANETEGGRVSRTRAVGPPAVQQSIKHPSVLAAPVTGSTAEERMGSVVDEEQTADMQYKIKLFVCSQQLRKGVFLH